MPLTRCNGEQGWQALRRHRAPSIARARPTVHLGLTHGEDG